MKTLEFRTLENIHGGGEISGTITGLCGAIFVGSALGWIALTTPQGVAVGIGCLVNGAASYYDWW
ncbi:hypothetical protein [Yeosuana sp.]|uniref:hypothetical protein n=1 Tax=Yeosuana sp. TaxID=2529388 RepID=UPI004048F9E8